MTLANELVANAKWPPPGHTQRLLDLIKYDRLFECDRATILEWVRVLRQIGGSDDDNSGRQVLHEFVPFPAPEIAARTLSTFLFGESAKIESEQVQDAIDDLVEDNHLHALNFEAGLTCCVGGEIYYKIDWDSDLTEQAIISAVPSLVTFPRFRYRRLLEVAFVVELDAAKVESNPNDDIVYRHVEIREKGRIINRLFKGDKEKLGAELELGVHPATDGLEEEVDTGIEDLLVRHIPFWRTSSSPHGISIFRSKEGLIEGLHALYTQDQHDAEMAKKRIGVPSGYLKRDSKGNPKFDRNTDIFELDDQAMGALGADSKPIHPIDLTDSTVQGERIAQRIDEFLLACGIAPQSAGRDVTGSAESGTARKLAQSLTLQTVAVAGRYFAPALRDIVDLSLQVAAKHLGRAIDQEYEIKVQLQDGLVDDDKEVSERINTLSGAGALSTEQKVRWLHPDWSDDMVQAEVERIREDEGLKIPPLPPVDNEDADATGGGAE